MSVHVPVPHYEHTYRKRVADYWRGVSCVQRVEEEMPLRRLGSAGPRANAAGIGGNSRPDVLVWCEHPRIGKQLTVIELKAVTATQKHVQQLWEYLLYVWDQECPNVLVVGHLVAPAYRVNWVPPAIILWPLGRLTWP